MGSNASVKSLVRAGLLCYNCEKVGPGQGVTLHKDEFGGMVCEECFELLRQMRLKYATSGAHVASRRNRFEER